MTIAQELATLEASGLILLANLHPEVEYLFRHVLIQDVAYHSLVRTNRRQLHQVVGESLERLYPDRLASAELAPLLARHFAEAGDQPRALRYHTLAGRAAAEMYANLEAIHHFGRALEVAQALPAAGEVIVDLFLRRGHALELNSQDTEALTNYEAMEAWAVAHGDQRARVAALTARATIYVKPTVAGDQVLGYDLSQQALGLARELGDRPAEAKILWNLLQHYLAGSKMTKALEHGERALELARAEGLREQEAYVLTDLSKVYFSIDQPERAAAAVAEARAIWRELGVLNMLADSLATTSMMNIMFGRYGEALALSEEAGQVSRAIGNLWNQSYAFFTVDLVHFDRGDLALAIATAHECLRLAEQAGFSEGINQSGHDLGLMYGYLGAVPRAFEIVRATGARFSASVGYFDGLLQTEALTTYLLFLDGRLAEAQAALDASPLVQNPKKLGRQFIMTHVIISQVQAELALARGDHPRALALADHTLARMRHDGVRLLLPDMLCLRGRVLRAAPGRASEAQSALEAARAEAEDLGSRRMLWLIQAELAGLAAEQGDPAAAGALWRQAAQIIDYIAAHAGAPDLRESFLHRPAVRQVLERAIVT